jgi:hypothetical protein
VGTRLTLAFLCILLISVGCIYFGKSRKDFRCPRVTDSMGETTATLGCVSELRGSHHLPLWIRADPHRVRDGPKVNLFKTAHRAILLCLDVLAGSPLWLLNSVSRGMRQRAYVVRDPN